MISGVAILTEIFPSSPEHTFIYISFIYADCFVCFVHLCVAFSKPSYLGVDTYIYSVYAEQGSRDSAWCCTVYPLCS